MKKRESARAIIIEENQMVVMYREKKDMIYYVFPGGGLEENEDIKDCVVREIKEEFGINIEPLKEVYIYEDSKTIQHFFTCIWKDGELGTGEGEEFQGNMEKGIYIPMLIDLNRLTDVKLLPSKVTKQLCEDLGKYGKDLRDNIKIIKED
ncbi:MAG: NUDIX domain-containing protein [Clostridia bacterium]|nr:NUDIX domain-containing protein [Clostridia bacterium]